MLSLEDDIVTSTKIVVFRAVHLDKNRLMYDISHTSILSSFCRNNTHMDNHLSPIWKPTFSIVKNQNNACIFPRGMQKHGTRGAFVSARRLVGTLVKHETAAD